MVLDWAIDSSTSRDGACVSSNSNHMREGRQGVPVQLLQGIRGESIRQGWLQEYASYLFVTRYLFIATSNKTLIWHYSLWVTIDRY
jgi:hypothetical protein